MIPEVQAYYDANAQQEWERLNSPYAIVEFRTTLHLMEQYFPQSGHILDIGSGPGRYAIEVLRRGLDVTLLDISSKELDIARDKIQSLGMKAKGYHCQSATDLSAFQDSTFDGLLIMGPLYHLHTREDRMKVLTEAYRVTKKGA